MLEIFDILTNHLSFHLMSLKYEIKKIQTVHITVHNDITYIIMQSYKKKVYTHNFTPVYKLSSVKKM